MRCAAAKGVVNPLLSGVGNGHHVRVNRRGLGWMLLGIGGAAVLSLPVLGALGHHPGWAWANIPLTLAYYGTGAVAFVQRPDNPAARRLLGFGCSLAVAFAVGYGYSALVTVHGVRLVPESWPPSSAHWPGR